MLGTYCPRATVIGRVKSPEDGHRPHCLFDMLEFSSQHMGGLREVETILVNGTHLLSQTLFGMRQGIKIIF